MPHYAALDVSNEETAIHIVDELGKTVWRGKRPAAIRQHWAIENGLNWVLDVTFGEDVSRVREPHATRNMAVLRRIALDLARANRSLTGLKGKRKCAAWDDRFMTKLIAG